MPTNNILSNQQFQAQDNVLVSEIGLRSPRMLTIDLDSFSVSAESDIILKPGSIITKLASGKGRVYPSGKATGATATTSSTVTLESAQSFKKGDVITKANGDAVGTIDTIDPETGEITLTANTTTAIAADDVLIANDASAGDVYGIIISEINVSKTSNDVACYTSASVYEARLPFWDASLQSKLPEITLVGPSV